MSVKQDLDKRLYNLERELDSLTKLREVSIGFTEVDGHCLRCLKPTGRDLGNLSYVGGIYSPVQHKYIARTPVPSIHAQVTPQQVPPLQSLSTILAVFGGMQAGKTEIGLYIALLNMCRYPGYIVFYCMPKLASKQLNVQDKFRAKAGHLVLSEEKKHRRFTLFNRSSVQFFPAGAGHEESFLGPNCDCFIVEEARELKRSDEGSTQPGSYVINHAFSRVASRGGRLVIVSSPEPNHVIENISNDKAIRHMPVEVHVLNSRKNIYTLLDHSNPQKMWDNVEKMSDPRRYQRNVLGLFVASGGQDYYNFNTHKHVIDIKKPPGVECTRLLWHSKIWLSKYPGYYGKNRYKIKGPPFDWMQHYTNLVGMDFGNRVMSAVLAKLFCHSGKPHITQADLDFLNTSIIIANEYVQEETDITKFIRTKLHPAGLYSNNTIIFCDPAGSQRSPSAGESAISILNQYGYKVFYRSEFRENSADAVRSRIQLDRFYVAKHCYQTIDSILHMCSRGRNAKDVSRDKYGHITDAIRYLIHFLYPFREVFYYGNEDYFEALQQEYGELDTIPMPILDEQNNIISVPR